MDLFDLPTPALVLDLNRLERNLGRMAERARRLGVRLRPHIKTHKSIEVARRQREHGAAGITVSTLQEARAFAAAGFDDITWAFPLIVHRLPEARELAERVRFAVTVDSREAVEALERSPGRFPVFLKIDCGYHRAGVDPQGELAVELASRLAAAPRLELAGILTHAGHAYGRRGRAALLEVADEERRVMVRCAERLREAGLVIPTVSVGSTPTMSVVEDLTGVDEMRPGNYAFYDLSQVVFGSCAATDCALTVIASVVSSQPGAAHSIVDAGALALSKDPGPTELGHASMGAILSDYATGGISQAHRLTGLSQEHGHLSGRLPVGDRVRILPNHSCLTAAQFDEYVVVDGERVVDRWPVLRGRDG